MTPKRTKSEKADDAIRKGKAVADVVKEFTPPEVDTMIDRGEQAVELGWGITKLIKGLFTKKKT